MPTAVAVVRAHPDKYEKAPATIMYFSAASREAVRIALMIAILHDLEFKLGNILNAYV